MAEAILKDDFETIEMPAPEAVDSGEIFQLPDGRAGVYPGLNTAGSGDTIALRTHGRFKILKTSGVVILKGGRVFWDKSASTATPLEAYGTNDFYLGTAAEDAASGDATVLVDLNVQPTYAVDLNRGEWETVVVLTAGTPDLKMRGGTAVMTFSATAEAQKVDLLSKQSVLASNGFIFEAKVAIYDIGDDAALDINIGVANGTHATDADSITESVFFHLDGSALDIKAESDDGTTEVTATDTTIDAVDDTYFEVWIDARDLTDIKLYIDGVQVLSGSTFKLDAATGPLKALAHIEKTSNDTTADVRIGHMAIRTMDILS